MIFGALLWHQGGHYTTRGTPAPIWGRCTGPVYVPEFSLPGVYHSERAQRIALVRTYTPGNFNALPWYTPGKFDTDFPYPPCSNTPEAVHLGDLLRIWVRPGAKLPPPRPGFQGPTGASLTPTTMRGAFQRERLYLGPNPFQRAPPLDEEKRTLPEAPAGVPGVVCVAASGPHAGPLSAFRVRGS